MHKVAIYSHLYNFTLPIYIYLYTINRQHKNKCFIEPGNTWFLSSGILLVIMLFNNIFRDKIQYNGPRWFKLKTQRNHWLLWK